MKNQNFLLFTLIFIFIVEGGSAEWSLLASRCCFIGVAHADSQDSDKLIQDYEVYQKDSRFYIRGVLDHEILKNTDDASTAIQFAIDQVDKTGGTVLIHRGCYPLKQPLTLKSYLTLKGTGTGTKLLVHPENTEGIAMKAFDIIELRVRDMKLTAGDNENAKTGIFLETCGDVKLIDLVVMGFAEYGIWMKNECYLSQVVRCTMGGNKKAAIYTDKNWRGKWGNYVPNQISECVIYGGGKGILCDRTTVLNINDCLIYQTGSYAFHLSQSNSVLISGCRTFQIQNDALRIEHSHEFNCSANIFCWHTGHGLMISDSVWGAINGNEIIDSSSWNSGKKDTETRPDDLPENRPLHNAITMRKVRGYQVTGNTIFNWYQGTKMQYGIYEDSHSFKNIIANNNVNYFIKADIDSSGRDTIVKDNISQQEHPYGQVPPRKFIQSFVPELTEQIIKRQK